MKKDLLETIFDPLFNAAQAFCNLINPTKMDITAKVPQQETQAALSENKNDFYAMGAVIHPEPVNMNRIDPHEMGIS